MVFPIIKIKDNYCKGEARIVGTNSHDLLYIDEGTGGIQYRSLQNCEGTKCYADSCPSYSFVAPRDADEYGPDDMEIEFLTIEDIVELYIKQTKESCKSEQRLREMLKKCMEEREKAIKENGLDEDDGTRNSVGNLI